MIPNAAHQATATTTLERFRQVIHQLRDGGGQFTTAFYCPICGCDELQIYCTGVFAGDGLMFGPDGTTVVTGIQPKDAPPTTLTVVKCGGEHYTGLTITTCGLQSYSNVFHLEGVT